MTEDKILNDYEKYPAKVVPYGNSRFVIIPAKVAKGLDIDSGDTVMVWIRKR